jgi:hypothetical protein
VIAPRIAQARDRVAVEAARARRWWEWSRYELTHIDRRSLLALLAAAVFAFSSAFAVSRATSDPETSTAANTSLDLSAISVNAPVPTHPDAVPSIADLVMPRPRKRPNPSSVQSSTPAGVAQPTGLSTAPAPSSSPTAPISPAPGRSGGGSTPQTSPPATHPSAGNGSGSFDSSG